MIRPKVARHRCLVSILITSSLGTACSPGTPASHLQAPINLRLSALPDGVVQLLPASHAAPSSTQLSLFGLPAGVRVTVQLQSGTCLAPSNRVLVNFGAGEVDTEGRLKATLAGDAPIPPSSTGASLFSVAVGSSTMGCTDLIPGNPTAALRLFPIPSERPSGHATLTYDAGRKLLRIEVAGVALPRSTQHAASIRLGTCEAEAATLYRLTDLTVDQAGNLDANQVLSHVTSPPQPNGWAVEIRTAGSTSSEGTGAIDRPLLCGTVGR